MYTEIKYGINYYQNNRKQGEIECNSLEDLFRVVQELKNDKTVELNSITTYLVIDGYKIAEECYEFD